MKYKFILFDVDGTLIDSADVLTQSFIKIMKEMTGKDVPPEKYALYWGVPAAVPFRDYGITDPAKIAYAEKKWGVYAKEIREWNPPFPGVEDMLKELVGRGCVLGVVTSKTHEALDIDFAPSPLGALLPNRVTASDTAKHKPEPEPIFEIIKRLCAKKEECLYIGDTIFDAQCAAAAGVDFALAGWGLIFGEPKNTGALAKLNRPEDLLSFVGE